MMTDETNSTDSAAQGNNTDAADVAGDDQQGTDDAGKLYDQSQGKPDDTNEGGDGEGGNADDKAGDEGSDGEGDDKGGDDGGSDKDESEGAPESYEQFSLPEGVTLEGERLEQATEFFKSKDWNQEQAQEAVDMFTKLQAQDAEASAKAYQDQQAEWVNEINADAEIGGKNKDASIAFAQKAIGTFGSDVLKEMLDASGMGNHPELVRYCARVGKALSEDSLDLGVSGGGQKDAASDLYKNSDHA